MKKNYEDMFGEPALTIREEKIQMDIQRIINILNEYKVFDILSIIEICKIHVIKNLLKQEEEEGRK